MKNTVPVQNPIHTGCDTDRILRIALDIGEGMLCSGAEINRVENTIERICKAYGAIHTEVFTITSLILAQIRMPSGEYSSQLRRVKSTSNNMMRLELFNALSRKICEHTPPVEDVERMIKAARSKKLYPLWLRLLASASAAAGFALFFGGNLLDAICAAMIGCLMYAVDQSNLFNINKMVKIAITSFIGGILASITGLIGFGSNVGIIMIGTIMLLVPGIAFGGALRNLLWGDLLAGTLEIIRAALTAFMIALGYMLSMFIMQGTYVPSFAPPHIAVQFFSLIFGVLGFAVIFSTVPKRLPLAVVGGLITFGAYFILDSFDVRLFICAFAASALALVFAEASARLCRAPATVFLLSCVLTIVPGGSLYNAMSCFISQSTSLAWTYIGNSVQIGLGIACGIAVGSIIFGAYEEIRKRILSKINH